MQNHFLKENVDGRQKLPYRNADHNLNAEFSRNNSREIWKEFVKNCRLWKNFDKK